MYAIRTHTLSGDDRLILTLFYCRGNLASIAVKPLLHRGVRVACKQVLWERAKKGKSEENNGRERAKRRGGVGNRLSGRGKSEENYTRLASLFRIFALFPLCGACSQAEYVKWNVRCVNVQRIISQMAHTSLLLLLYDNSAFILKIVPTGNKYTNGLGMSRLKPIVAGLPPSSGQTIPCPRQASCSIGKSSLMKLWTMIVTLMFKSVT